MNINDMFPSRWLKAEEFGEDDQILTISSINMENVGQGDEAETKPVLFFKETEKGLVLNKTNGGTIATQYGGDTESWIGKKVKLYATEVDFKGKTTLGIRVRLPRPPKPAVAASRPAPSARVPVAAGVSEAGPDWGDGEDD